MIPHRLYLSILSGVVLASWSSSASAQAPTGDGTGDCKCLTRYSPTRHQLELGILLGTILPADDSHELYDPLKKWAPYKTVVPGLGARLGYYPLPFLGLEVDGALGTTKIDDDEGGRALLGTFRGYAMLQVPHRIAPFGLVGMGLLGARSDRLGADLDPIVHFGGGVKFYINRWFAARIDVRDSLGAKHGVDAGKAHHAEVLFGLSLLLNRKAPAKKPPAPAKDSDGDGFLDDVDRCRAAPGVAPDGCPPPPPPADPDRDGDGLADLVDACPADPGSAPDGCPDGDGDGFKDNVDRCPQQPGVAPDGCPPPDADADGILDAQDACVHEPETRNDYQDVDGCPDEVPQAVTAFAGVKAGINFDVGSATISTTSRPALDSAVKLLTDFPAVRVEISGHTDSDGDREHNVALSLQRADAVKQYLVDHGVDATRLTTSGHGPDRPLADNATWSGKSRNRRIEFKLLGD